VEEEEFTTWKTDKELIGELDGNQELFEKWTHEGLLRANQDGLYPYMQFIKLRAAIYQPVMRHRETRAVGFKNI